MGDIVQLQSVVQQQDEAGLLELMWGKRTVAATPYEALMEEENLLALLWHSENQARFYELLLA